MLGEVPKTYRSRYKGIEIDSLLASIGTKLDKSYIVNDFKGGADLVASAELAKTLYENINQFTNANYIKNIILSIPDTLLFTKSDKAKLDQLAGVLQGSFLNVAARNIAVNTVGFKGGELTFIMNNDEGIQELDYWDSGSLTWKKSAFLANPVSTEQSYTAAGANVVITMNTTKYSTGQYLVKVESGSQIRIFSIILAIKSNNIYWTTGWNIGDLNGVSITSVALNAGNTECRISLTMPANVKVKFSRISEF